MAGLHKVSTRSPNQLSSLAILSAVAVLLYVPAAALLEPRTGDRQQQVCAHPPHVNEHEKEMLTGGRFKRLDKVCLDQVGRTQRLISKQGGNLSEGAASLQHEQKIMI